MSLSTPLNISTYMSSSCNDTLRDDFSRYYLREAETSPSSEPSGTSSGRSISRMRNNTLVFLRKQGKSHRLKACGCMAGVLLEQSASVIGP